MSRVVIYETDEGIAAVVIPSPEALAVYGITAIAEKDVPVGKPYKIIDESELPTDRSERMAWRVDPADLTDGVGAEWTTFDHLESNDVTDQD